MIFDEFGHPVEAVTSSCLQRINATIEGYLSTDVRTEIERERHLYEALGGLGIVDQFGRELPSKPMLVSCRKMRVALTVIPKD